MIDFTDEQLERYSRNIILEEIDFEGQTRIMEAKVLIIGVGGLGSPVALYLAAAGVGTIGIVDNDVVEISNLQRQIIHFTKDLQIAKTVSAAEKMQAISPELKIKCYQTFVNSDNIEELISKYDFVIDGTDNFTAKFLINDACVLGKIPYVHGGILGFTGQIMTVVPEKSACYRCVFGEAPPADTVRGCSQVGVLGATAGMLGTMQATEALKFITKTGKLLTDRLMTFDALEMEFRTIKLKRQKGCPLCGSKPVITSL